LERPFFCLHPSSFLPLPCFVSFMALTILWRCSHSLLIPFQQGVWSRRSVTTLFLSLFTMLPPASELSLAQNGCSINNNQLTKELNK
jgi:hypothetical protein